jgi:DNA-binding MarR family transcriptional regulator
MDKSSRPEDGSPLNLLHRAGVQADSLFVNNLGGARLTPRQYAVLKAVSQADGLSQTAIMTATGIDRSSTAELVRRLVSFGALQRRRRKQDARQYAVRLTSKGKQLLALGNKAAQQADAAILNRLPLSLRSSFLEGLRLTSAVRPAKPDEAGGGNGS